jgi:hypothetical protein
MALTNDELNAFHRFADHLDSQTHSQNVAAVRAAIRDMENGDRGRPATQLLNELRAKLTAEPHQ